MNDRFDDIPNDNGSVIRQHSKSFALASRLLAPRIRADVRKLYAWCRWCDDAVDAAPDKVAALARIEELQQDVQRIDAGHSPMHGASAWLNDLVRRYHIPLDLPSDLLTGMRRDVESPVLETYDELMEYAYQAAGTVGLMMCRVMGVSEPRSYAHAKALGIAMQLTNIARDVREDWEIGRRYLPSQWLPFSPTDTEQPSEDAIVKAVRKALSVADEHYAIGYRGLCYIPDDARLAIRLAGKVYQEIGHQIRRENFPVWHKRVHVGTPRKVLLVASACGREWLYRRRRGATGEIDHMNQIPANN